jgi:RNA polymerase sigma-70 factor (ECF subfamily)
MSLERHNESFVQAFRSGDSATWSQLIHEKEGKLRGTLLASGVKPQDVEDLEQDVLLKTWENRANIDPARNIGGYINSIAHNLAIDKHRQNYRRMNQVPNAPDANGFTPLDKAQDPQDVEEEVLTAVYDREISPVLQEALDSINPKQREVVVFSAAGKTLQQISDETHTPIGTVKTRSVRGRENLRKLLGPKL